MIVVTGGAGFIGSRVIRHLNDCGITNIIVVDDLTNGQKFRNLKGLDFAHYVDKDSFLTFLSRKAYYIDIESDEGILADVLISDIDTIIHLGAISDTTYWDGKEMMKNNYDYSTKLLDHLISLGSHCKFIYASSASVYGNKQGEADPLNVYAFSKYLFDKYVISAMSKADSEDLPQIVGLRFFNVYGSPNEWHKENQSSPIYKFYREITTTGQIKIFDRAAERDFVHVDDVCSVVTHFLNNKISGIFDVGTGKPRSFRDVAECIHRLVMVPFVFKPRFLGPTTLNPVILEIPFPPHLDHHYQYYTCANLTDGLHRAGYTKDFMTLEQGVEKFIKEMKEYETLHCFEK